MQVDKSIFKAYDIRGIYGTALFEDTAEAVGKAFVKVIGATNVIVGRDARVSSPALHARVIQGLTSVGANVIDLGMVSTDMYYYACATKDLPGIMITASHNPKEYNGFKMVRKIPYLLSGDEGIQDIRQIIEADAFPPAAATPGTVSQWDVMPEFIQKITTLVDLTAIKPMKVIADTANGMVGPTLDEFYKHLPQVKLTPMYFEPDGNFPNHGGDPLMPENRAEIEQRVVAEGADLGFLFDPDGDRFFVIDQKGRFIAGDFLTALLAEYFLNREPGSTIVYDIRSSYAVKDRVTQLGGRALYNRVGHAYIKKRMMDENAIFGGEVTGHYYFRDFYFCDSGIAPMIYLLDLLSKEARSLDQLVDDLTTMYHISGEINTRGVDSAIVFQRIHDEYKGQAHEVLDVDGISMDFGDWHFNVRASNTEPLVRLNLEAKTYALMEQKREELLALIREGLNKG